MRKRENTELEGLDEELEVQNTNLETQNAELETQNAALEARNAELLNDLQRTRADFENFRKQTEMQTEMQKDKVKLATVYKILPLLDDISRATQVYEELKPLEKSLAKTLKELGLKKIDSSEGVEFNPDIHDAVTMEGDGEGKEVVAEALRDGYYYEGGVLRPAMVKVKTLKK